LQALARAQASAMTQVIALVRLTPASVPDAASIPADK